MAYLLKMVIFLLNGPNRNRWFTVLKNEWIFPWQTVNVITRWYYKRRQHARSGETAGMEHDIHMMSCFNPPIKG